MKPCTANYVSTDRWPLETCFFFPFTVSRMGLLLSLQQVSDEKTANGPVILDSTEA